MKYYTIKGAVAATRKSRSTIMRAMKVTRDDGKRLQRRLRFIRVEGGTRVLIKETTLRAWFGAALFAPPDYELADSTTETGV